MSLRQYIRFFSKNGFKLSVICQRNTSGRSDRKSNTGRIIKDLNKENKALFGKLLETRNQRRKNAQTGLIRDDVNINENSAGIRNQKLKSVAKNFPFFEKHVIKINGANEKDNVKVIEASDLGTTEHKDELNGVSNVPLISKDSKTDSVLPPVIIKNLTNYPLINCHKNIELSYSLEQFDRSCITNKHLSKVYPSVSKILNVTMSEHSKMLLKKWREKMISEMGEEAFMNFYKAQLNAGVQFHAAVQSFLRGTPEDDLLLDGQGVNGCWNSLSSVMPKIHDVQVLEGPVFHPNLLYHGVMDCVAVYNKEPVVIEWKKSDKPKPTIDATYDAPIQLCAYLGAMNFDKNYPVQVNGGLVVVAYSDGSPGEIYHLSLPECYKYWRLWLQRLQSFRLQEHQAHSVSEKASS